MRTTSRFSNSPRRRTLIPRAISRNPFTTLVWGLAAVIILCVVSVGGYSLFSTLTVKNTVTCTVESKERAISGESSTKLVYTADCGVFSVDDSLIYGKFNSADTYGSIKEGGTYVFETRGVRNGLFSMFPNIIEMQEVTQ